jgi:hypothetical protein
MTIQNYLMINETTNIVENVIVWDGNPDTWGPPGGYLMLIQATTPSKVWVLNTDKTDFVLTEVMGGGQIGFTWDGSICNTNQPKPVIPT